MIRTEIAELSYLEEGVLITKIAEGAEINLENSKANFVAAQSLTLGRRYTALSDGIANATITKEAMEFGGSFEANEFLIAHAIVVTSLANRLIGNFIIKFHKPKAPTKLFRNYEDALLWLREMLQREKMSDLLTKNKLTH
jgi:hypothetical protein